MSELTRKCNLEHKPYYKLIHSGGKLFDDLTILCCNDCVSRSPFCNSKLEREPINNE